MASKARLVVTAVVVEGRSPSEVARTYGVARSWIYTLVARYHADGDTAFEARSRRPKTSPNAIDDATTELILDLRRTLTRRGLDAGPETIAWHLAHHHQIRVHRATIYRTLQRHGLIVAEPKKKPRSSYIRFEAEQPNECWQADFTHYRLADGTDTEILTWLDDHSRYALTITAHQPVTGTIVLNEFRAATAEHGPPASTLTDNGLVFTARFAGGRGGRNHLEAELHRLGIQQKNSRPNHPTTCGKVELGLDYAPLVYLGAVLGLRWGECAGLRVGRIDFSRSTMTVAEQITRGEHGEPRSGPPKTGAGNRTLSVPTPLIDLLAEHLARRGLTEADTDDFVFAMPEGGPLVYQNFRNRRWLPACREVGVDRLGFHDLRRLNATGLVMEGIDVKTAQSRLGHSDPRLTLASTRNRPPKLTAPAQRLASRFMP